MRLTLVRTELYLSKLATILALAAVVAPGWALDCSVEDVYLHSQADVNDFQALYGSGSVCDTVTGSLTIAGSDIGDLAPLSDLTTIGGRVTVESNPLLESLDGLAGLTSIGIVCHPFGSTCESLVIRNNATLLTIDALSNLTASEGNVEITDNPLLTNLDGLSGITRIERMLYIARNQSLTQISGLSSLTGVGVNGNTGVSIVGNPSLVNLNGLGSLSRASWLVLENNDALTDVDGLSNLSSLDTDLYIDDNDALTSLDGFAGLHGGMGYIQIQGNDALTNLNGLSLVEQLDSGLYVGGNASLADCQGVVKLIDPIDDYEPGPGPDEWGIPDVIYGVEFSNNLPDCNSVNDVLGSTRLSEINAGLNDAWFNPDNDGQGFFITVYPEIEQIFMSWFTFDVERPDPSIDAQLGEPGHRWLTAQGPFLGNSGQLEIWIAEGGVFESPIPEVELREDGEISLEFESCNEGTVSFDIPSVGLHGVVPIERIALDNVPSCYVLENQP